MNDDLFSKPAAQRRTQARKSRAPADTPRAGSEDYDASAIEVLEGLEPVRRRPGMYIGGTDETAYHHLASEILDNAMDEAVAGHASVIDVSLEAGNWLTIRDNGRGIPVDPHPKFPQRSALEVILTTLHAGGKFSGKAYATSGGLHGVGSSVVNALSARMEVEIARDRTLWQQVYERGVPLGPVEEVGPTQNRRGTQIRFVPDPQIFGKLHFSPLRLYRLCRSKAFLFRGVTIRWSCDPSLIKGTDVPAEAVLHFPGGLADSLRDELGNTALLTDIWAGDADLPTTADGESTGRMEWAIAFVERGTTGLSSYCNTIPTPNGGTHETGFRTALTKGLRNWGEQRSNKRAATINADDIMGLISAKLSVFIRDPQFQGQTKEKLTSSEASRLVETALRDRFDHWLAGNPPQADNLLAVVIERAEERLRRKEMKDTPRKSATRRLRLPGKLTDCTRENAAETEIFLVEGDSAGGSAKQARNRETQAVLPLRGKILNVASASAEKLRANQELRDLVEALGCGIGERFDASRLRYGRIIIMTDADVDGAHIASLLMTFFYRELPALIRGGHLYLAQPPLYRLTQGGKTVYAMDDADRERRLKREFKPNAKVEVSRFKGLGEMPPSDLKQTTMDPKHRTLLKVVTPMEDSNLTRERVEHLMGRKPELRFQFIQEHARQVENLDI
ncbi:DNA topoisomerase IV subunit B [Gluconacetobacter entanii]|uniref:DNA topoisomerase 4 subunit B n=1 Tax=Gluconacetobacter entanii TaxID=108528 RepID=A0ABT3K7H6_9PROT|nr:DNA topoisomerase IV subunit B [Gluconacetobacter entanii]MBE7618147.1 DNA topoisomerase IV subunit B [Komagataeibacter sp. FXV2]MBY4641110.1 DNA topoisomerase IV subunit B [Gluconacetobacter entanii]MCW4580630.1 DNA topoisomerase IV subunit B [Gluconacetobacter entanii]MCW4583980.1 DNA topoisomerase IV subunit B [Gluconacetobacter entanii]MCW4587304.1 DNA topoisomerase IV subunit B [Gluconacetobacter entanii]